VLYRVNNDGDKNMYVSVASFFVEVLKKMISSLFHDHDSEIQRIQ